MPAGKGTYGSRKGRPPKNRGFASFLGAPGKILKQKPKKKKKPEKAKEKPRQPSTPRTSNNKPMTPVKNGNGTKGKLTAAQKTLPEFLQKKIKAAKKRG